jgi:hypothetical protein
LSRIDRGTDAKVDRARTRASSDASRATHISRRLRAGTSRRSVVALASIFALCGTAVAIAAPGGTTIGDTPTNPGNPSLAQVGPVAKNGFPAWYKDAGGTRLEACLDASNPLCIMGALGQPDQPVTPDNVAGNFPDEFFYQAASSGIDNVGANIGTAAKPRFGKALAVTSLEGAFATGPPKAGDQMVFARLRLKVTAGLQGGTNYLFEHPYGERTIQTDPNTDNLFVTEDVGLAPGNFTDALKGRIAPFLKWDSNVAPAAPDGYTGDPNVDHRITGGANDYFAIVGPGIGANRLGDGTQDCPDAVIAKAAAAPGGAIKGTGPDADGDGNPDIGANDCIYQNLFSLMGKQAENAGVDVKTATFSRDTTGNTTVDIQAESDGNQTIVVQDPGPSRHQPSRLFPTTKLVEDRGNYYGHVTMASTKGFPNGSEKQVQVLNATDGTPQDSKTVAPVDEILNATATFDTTPDANGKGALTVAAQSSDAFPGDSVKLSVDNPAGGAPTDLDGTGKATLALGSAPRSVTITSSKGGTLTIPVHTDVAAPATPAPLTANAGRPAKASAGQSVTLFGTGSTGPVASYSWSGPFAVNPDGTVDTATPNDANGGGVTDASKTTDTAELTAPSAAGQYGYQLEVTGDDAATAKATTILTVGNGGAVAGGALGDPLTPGKTRYTQSQGRMVIDGTATVASNNKILIWFANHVPADLTTKPDATATVDPVDGSWVYDTGRDGMPNPPNSDCVSYISTHGDPNTTPGDVVNLTPAADEWNCILIDGRNLTAPLPAGPPPPGGPVVGAAAGGPRALARAVPVVGATAPALAPAAKVAAPATVTAAALAKAGVPINVAVPSGATVLRVRVLTTANRALLTTFQKVKGGKKVKVTVRTAKVARKLRAGKRFVIEVRAGTAKNRLGKATRKVIRVRG